MILVTGATGHVGKPLLEELVAVGRKVRALTRNTDLPDLPTSVEVAETVDLPLDGITSVFFVTAAFPQGTAEPIAKMAAAGVQRIVALSSYSVLDDDPKNMIGVKHRELERQIEDSGLEWTFIRPAGGFAATALEWAEQIRTKGVARFPFGDAQTAPVHERDIAAVAARALLTDDLVGKAPLFSGPESLSYRDRARIIGSVTREPVTFDEITEDEARREWSLAGVPPHAVEARLGMFARLTHGPHDVSPVDPILGRSGLGFAQWVAEHIDDFRKVKS
ncbi:NAD(P)H-binding protein [Rhodococcoides yunnanense]|uniref:NAD(P)H-binding protein n=1 Tax=Rhodococcoides yunnanense TaxID=278209 RepID=A0ABU4BID3_9NOCA|nr:NAD(P)H-binding protein [Rhodococcus yunnanensis]MDV6263940.1 NAD(P)H-binding protein [Rhodococcus yunnanensis]